MLEKSVDNFWETGDPQHLIDVARITLYRLAKLRWSEVLHWFLMVIAGGAIAAFIFWVFIMPIMAGWYAHEVEGKGYMESWREAQIIVLGGGNYEEVN